jgi:histidinol-phosphatase (PHP family)
MRRICRAAQACGLSLEYNLLGLQGNRHYPNPIFWELAAEENCSVLLGRDAHAPHHLLDTATEEKALQFLSSLGLKPLENTPLISI